MLALGIAEEVKAEEEEASSMTLFGYRAAPLHRPRSIYCNPAESAAQRVLSLPFFFVLTVAQLSSSSTIYSLKVDDHHQGASHRMGRRRHRRAPHKAPFPPRRPSPPRYLYEDDQPQHGSSAHVCPRWSRAARIRTAAEPARQMAAGRRLVCRGATTRRAEEADAGSVH